MTTPAAEVSPRKVRLALAAVVAAAMLLRIPAFRFPLDQDCGEYAYCAQEWAAGKLPYKDVWDHKPPLIYLVYRGLFAVAGSAPGTVAGTLRVGSALCDAATAVVLFLLVRRLFGPWQGVAAAALFGLFMGMPGLQLMAFQPENLTALLATAGLLVASSYVRSWRYSYAFLAGLLLGLGITAKQIIAPVAIVAWAWMTLATLRDSRFQITDSRFDSALRTPHSALARVAAHTALMAAGALLPFALFAGYFALRGALAEFWECTFTYNVVYAAELRKGGLVDGLRRMVVAKVFDHAALWLLAAAGIAVALRRPAPPDSKSQRPDSTPHFASRTPHWRGGALVLLGWTAAAFLGLFLPGQFAHYYYIPTIPPLAAAAGVGAVALIRLARGQPLSPPGRGQGEGLPSHQASTLPLPPPSEREGGTAIGRVVAVACGALLLAMLAFAAKRGYGEYKLTMNAEHPNWVVARLAKTLGMRTQPGDRLFMFGGRPQFYVLAGRQAPTKYLFNFSYQVPLAKAYLFRDQVRSEIMAGLKQHAPPYIVVAITEKGELDGFPELKDYLAAHYAEEQPWQAKVHKPHTYTLRVFHRREGN